VRIWDVPAALRHQDIVGAQERDFLVSRADPVTPLSVAPDGSWLAPEAKTG
jgi:hypothetical protein